MDEPCVQRGATVIPAILQGPACTPLVLFSWPFPSFHQFISFRVCSLHHLVTNYTTSDWVLAIDAWIEVVEQHNQRQRAAKDRSVENQAQLDRLRVIRDNMKRRMG